MFKITFKKNARQTGLASIASPYPDTQIKESGKVIGHISAPNWKTEDNKWCVFIAVKKDKTTPHSNCDWKWIRLIHRFDSEPEARKVVKENIQRIVGAYTLHYFED